MWLEDNFVTKFPSFWWVVTVVGRKPSEVGDAASMTAVRTQLQKTSRLKTAARRAARVSTKFNTLAVHSDWSQSIIIIITTKTLIIIIHFFEFSSLIFSQRSRAYYTFVICFNLNAVFIISWAVRTLLLLRHSWRHHPNPSVFEAANQNRLLFNEGALFLETTFLQRGR